MVKSKASRRKNKPQKPAKPYPEFPLFPHQTRRWAKKIKGRTFYFGPWSDPQGALDKFLAERDDLYAGRKPRMEQGGFTVEDAVDGHYHHVAGDVGGEQPPERQESDDIHGAGRCAQNNREQPASK